MHSRSFFRNPSPILVGPCGLFCPSGLERDGGGVTEDLGFREILRRIYSKVCMFGFDSSTPCLLLFGSNLGAS